MNFKSVDANLLVLYLIIFLDYLGYGIILPVLNFLLLSEESKLFSSTQLGRYATYVIIVSIYPFFQAIGAPIIGALADVYGRKKIMLMTLIGSIIGYSTFLIGFSSPNLYVLILGRLIAGFMGGNSALANTIVSDSSPDKYKIQNFGFIGIAMGTGIVFGPFLGGRLSDIEIDLILFQIQSYTMPFYASVFLSIIAFLLAVFFLKETGKISPSAQKISILKSLKSYLIKNFSHSNSSNYLLKRTFVMSFVLFLIFNIFVHTLNIHFSTNLGLKPEEIGDLLSFAGVCLLITMTIINPIISRKINNLKTLRISLIGLAWAIFIFMFFDSYKSTFLIIPFFTAFYGLSQARISFLISSFSGPQKKGESFGFNQSLQSLIETLSPLISAIFFYLDKDAPIIFILALSMINIVTLEYIRRKLEERGNHILN